MSATNSPNPWRHRLRYVARAARRKLWAWGLAAWATACALVSLLSQYDLALSQLMPPETASKFPRAYQALAAISAWLSMWQFWVSGSLVIALAAAVEYGVRAERRGEQNAEARRKAATLVRPAIPADAPISIIAAKAGRFIAAIEKGLTESPKPRLPTSPLPPDPEPDWSRIFTLSEDGHDVRLLVIPDVEDDLAGHSLLLALYAYRILKSYARVPISQAAGEAIRALKDAPNAPLASRAFPFLTTIQALEPEKFGTGIVKRGEAERIALRTGGAYELTPLGLQRADDLARDLIRRA